MQSCCKVVDLDVHLEQDSICRTDTELVKHILEEMGNLSQGGDASATDGVETSDDLGDDILTLLLGV